MKFDNKVLIGRTETEDLYIYPKMANRHGLIAGATGTGKTVTLKVMAESFSELGVPVFLADAKGDLSGMCVPGEASGSVAERVEALGLTERGFSFKGFPVNYWDVFGETGMPLRTTVSEMGPLLLARILELNDTQSDVLNVIFKIADDEQLLLIDIKDLKSMVRYVGDNAKDYSATYGNIAPTTISAITRAIVSLESQGAESFFGEPALNVADWLTTDSNGMGMIEILDCRKLMMNPRMYSMFLLWLISELFEMLPEVGDPEKPRMVFFFDEAHMLFDGAPKVLLEKVEQVVKLIRSKGVGIYFITQNPKDIPDGVLSQLGNKVQHALRAYTPADMKGVKAAAAAFRENPAFKTFDVLAELGTGEALVSVLGPDGIPTIVERGKILPPESKMGMIDDAKREEVMKSSLLYTRYSDSFDRDSAYEFLQRHAAEKAEEEEKAKAEEEARKEQEKADKEAAKQAEREEKEQQKQLEKEQKKLDLAEAQAKARAEKEALMAKSKQQKAINTAMKSTARTVTGTIGRELGNSIGSSIGGSFGKKLGGNLGASLGRGLIGTLFMK